MELSSAIARGVRQLVLIGMPRKPRVEVTDHSGDSLQVFAVDEQDRNDFGATFVPTRFQSELLSSALGRSRLKASLFILLGDARYRTGEAILCTLSFIASLPKGSGVIFDYAEHGCLGDVEGTALESLATRVSCAGNVKHLIQPQAVAAMLRGLGFGRITDHIDEDLSPANRHVVSALV